MSDSNQPSEQLGMPVAEVIAYLTEIASYNQMIADRLVSQIEVLGEALSNFADATTLAAQADAKSDEG